jgi:hypothetical protein
MARSNETSRFDTSGRSRNAHSPVFKGNNGLWISDGPRGGSWPLSVPDTQRAGKGWKPLVSLAGRASCSCFAAYTTKMRVPLLPASKARTKYPPACSGRVLQLGSSRRLLFQRNSPQRIGPTDIASPRNRALTDGQGLIVVPCIQRLPEILGQPFCAGVFRPRRAVVDDEAQKARGFAA